MSDKRRKHRLVVDISLSSPVTERDAVKALTTLHERLDLDAKPIWPHTPGNYAQKLTVQAFSRTLQPLRRKLQALLGELP